jgi:hypothetical protein
MPLGKVTRRRSDLEPSVPPVSVARVILRKPARSVGRPRDRYPATGVSGAGRVNNETRIDGTIRQIHQSFNWCRLCSVAPRYARACSRRLDDNPRIPGRTENCHLVGQATKTTCIAIQRISRIRLMQPHSRCAGEFHLKEEKWICDRIDIRQIRPIRFNRNTSRRRCRIAAPQSRKLGLSRRSEAHSEAASGDRPSAISRGLSPDAQRRRPPPRIRHERLQLDVRVAPKRRHLVVRRDRQRGVAARLAQRTQALI